MRLGSYYRSLIAPGLGVKAAQGQRVLEVGAADAQLLQTLRPDFGIALDPAPIPQDDVTFLRADGRFAPLKSDSFDMVVAFDVLEHVEDDAQLVGELFRVAKAGATVWIGVPSKDFTAFPSFLTTFFHKRWGHVRHGYRPEELRAMLPPDVSVEVIEWNEPFYRFCYIPLRLFSLVSAAGARALLRHVARLDSMFAAGCCGHYFLRVSSKNAS